MIVLFVEKCKYYYLFSCHIMFYHTIENRKTYNILFFFEYYGFFVVPVCHSCISPIRCIFRNIIKKQQPRLYGKRL